MLPPGLQGPSASAPISPIIAPKDRAYGGEIELQVDATDIGHRVMRVHETLSGVRPDTVLLYPKWLPGTHAPEGTIDRLGGLRLARMASPVTWKRDPVDVFAFRLHCSPERIARYRLRVSVAHQRQGRRTGDEP